MSRVEIVVKGLPIPHNRPVFGSLMLAARCQASVKSRSSDLLNSKPTMQSLPDSTMAPAPVFQLLFRYLKFLGLPWFFGLTLLAAGNARAGLFEEGDILMVQAAPDAIHFNPSPEHADYSWLVGAELQFPSRWLVGGAYFNNSFDQKCQYYYFGKSWSLDFISDSEFFKNMYFKLTGGILLGYKEPYEDKIPFNNNGMAPGVVPGLGYQIGDFNIQLNLLGGAGLMFTFGYNLIQW